MTEASPIVDDEAVASTARYPLIVFMSNDSSGWLPAILSLGEIRQCESIVVAGTSEEHTQRLVTVDVQSDSLSEVLRGVAASTTSDWIVVAGEPCLVPSGLVDRLRTFEDERFASVCFLCNAADALSFPHTSVQVPWSLDDGSPNALTAKLREFCPLPSPVPVPVVAGPVVAFSTDVVRMLPSGWDRGCETFAEMTASFGLTAQARGLINILDAATYVHRAADLRTLTVLDESARGRLTRRFPWMPTAIALAVTDPASPLKLEHGIARSKISGLDVLLDGSCLGPREMGTQVGLLAIAAALAARSDVARVAITLPNELPAYARHLLHEPKISFIPNPVGAEIAVDRHFDVAFRPFQPDHNFDPLILRRKASRVLVSLLDLIAFQNGSYFGSGEDWVEYRAAISGAMRHVDAVTTISHDVMKIVEMERLPIPPDRVYPVTYGTEHLQISEPSYMPREFDIAPGARFIVSLGTNYGHKNRDISIRTLSELRRRGHDVSLVLVGPNVPHGSSRYFEAEAMQETSSAHVVSLSSVPAEERNWLLAHAEAVLYPTSAEGFGLVPYEAAWLGTPTVFVPFGPLSEIAGDLPMEARDWSPESFADQIEKLLADPALGEAQVLRLREASARSTWGHTASRLCDVFRSVLSKPPHG